jgi:hypothetical protein
MPYIRVIATGHIIEVYEYEHAPFVPFEKDKDDQMTDYLLTGDETVFKEKPAWLKELEKKQRNKRNAQASKNTFTRTVKATFLEHVNFITLTFAENLTDISMANYWFNSFMKRLRRRFGKEFRMAVVVEFQERGAVHFHMLADLGISWETEEECKSLERWFAREIWTHGFVDLKDVKHVDNLGAYMAKYMTKRLSDPRLAGKKAYRTSHNMDRPLILKNEEAKHVIELYQLGQKKEVYTNSYESEYLGKVTYKEYNLKRLEKGE